MGPVCNSPLARLLNGNRPLSHSGHFESQENKKLCFCPSSLALDKRSDGQNLLFQHRLIKAYSVSLEHKVEIVLHA